MDFGQWCSPCCCTGCKCKGKIFFTNVKEKKSDSTEYQFASKYVSASESRKAKPMLDGFWLWLILLVLKEREDVEGAAMCVSELYRTYQTRHQNSCVGGKENHLNFWKSPLCFPSVIFLHAPERMVSILRKGLYPWFSFSVACCSACLESVCK